MPKISIITPVYNVEKFVSQCIESVMSQSYDDWELILVDDCSTDNSGRICDDYASKDSRIRVIHVETNSGALGARNCGIKEATGDYIGFLDSDDWIEKDYMSILIDELNKCPVDILAFSYFLDYKNRTVDFGKTGDYTSYSKQDALRTIHFRNNKLTCMMCNKIFNKGIVKEYATKVETVVGEDYSMLVSFIMNSEKVAYLDIPLYHYRQRASSVCNIGFTNKRWATISNYYDVKDIIVKEYPALEQELIVFCIIQELALIMAMGSSGYYDKEVTNNVMINLKQNISCIFKAKNSDIFVRICAILAMISPSILYLVGKIRKKLKVNNLY